MARALRWGIAALAALTSIRLLFAAILPLTPDEAYYWVWSHALAPGYVDHPPMVALWIRAGTLLLGERPMGVRLLGPLAVCLETLLLANAAERIFPAKRAGWTTGALWNATLLVGAGSVTMTPDAPLLLFWCATLWAMVRIATGGGDRWWLFAGLVAGLALDSKYTAAFLWVGVGFWVLAVPTARQRLSSPAPWLGGLLGLAIFLPVVIWNADHGWTSFLKQGGRVGDWRPEQALGFLAELIGGQIGFATPGVWVLCVAGVTASFRRDTVAILLLALSVLPTLVFLQHALGDRVQGNWPAIVYPAAIVAAAGLTELRWTRLIWPSVGLGFAFTAIVLLHAALGIIPLPPRADPAARQLADWPALALAVEELRQRDDASYVVAEEYALLAELAWNAPAAMPVVGIDTRLRPMTLPLADLAGRTGILVRAEHRGEDIDHDTWASAVFLGVVVRSSSRGPAERYRVWRVVGQTQAVVLPHRELAELR